MENHGDENHVEIEFEEISDDFQCCVCLELLYKPVVIGCGHIACFWCVFKAMDSLQDSSCPICRHPYNHFPRVCRLMHFLLLKLYPLSYKRREMQVTGEEKKDSGFTSPQFDDYASEACCQELVNDPASSHSIGGWQISDSPTGETSLVHELPKNTKGGDKFMEQNAKHELLIDLKCGICKQLLCWPVVLNCGHVYCGNCVFNQCDKLCRCPVCQMEHPNGYPNTCLVLEHFLEEQFPEEYAARKRTSLSKSDSELTSTSTCGIQMMKAAHSSSAPKRDYRAWLSGEGPTVHYRVGCDYCGMYPIVGDRYKCKDCTESIGFDLCEGCYKSSSNLPGRFNQQHTPEHKFDLIPPVQFGNLILVRDPQQPATGQTLYAYVDDSMELASPEYDPEETASGSVFTFNNDYDYLELVSPEYDPEETASGSVFTFNNGEDTDPYMGAQGNSTSGEVSQNDYRENPSNSASDNTRGSA